MSTAPTAPLPSPAPRRSAPWRRWLDHASIYLPVLLMGALALGSYWLLRTAPVLRTTTPAAPPSTEPDYTMQRFAVKTFDAQGRLASEVAGLQARHYPIDDRTEIEQARMLQINDSGQRLTAQAQRVTVKSGQTHYQLEGDVRVLREAGRNASGQAVPAVSFAGESLRLDTQANQIESDQPVTLTRGADKMLADRLRYDDQTRIADLDGRVRATLAPR